LTPKGAVHAVYRECNSAQNETRHRWLLLPGCTLYGVKNVARNFMDWLVSLSVLAVNGFFAKLMGFHLYIHPAWC